MSICVLKPDLAQQYQASAKVSIFIATFPRKNIFLAHTYSHNFLDNCCACICYLKVCGSKENILIAVLRNVWDFFVLITLCGKYTEHRNKKEKKNKKKKEKWKTFLPHIVYAAAVFSFFSSVFCELVRHPQHFHLSICDCAPKLSRTHTHWLHPTPLASSRSVFIDIFLEHQQRPNGKFVTILFPFSLKCVRFRYFFFRIRSHQSMVKHSRNPIVFYKRQRIVTQIDGRAGRLIFFSKIQLTLNIL